VRTPFGYLLSRQSGRQALAVDLSYPSLSFDDCLVKGQLKADFVC